MSRSQTLMPGAATPIEILHPAEAGWQTDPLGEHKLRYHDGAKWTDAVTHFGPVPCLGCEKDHR